MDSVLTLASGAADAIPIANWDGDGPGWWIVLVPLFWFLVIFGLIYLFRGRGPRGPWASRGSETGIQVLERRFAEGELSLEQYRERRSVLEEKR